MVASSREAKRLGATPEPGGRLRGVLGHLEGLASRPSGRSLRPHPGADVRAPARPWGAAGARAGRGLRVQGTFVTLVADKAAFCLPGRSHGGDLACKELLLRKVEVLELIAHSSMYKVRRKNMLRNVSR
eukprot:bmy_04284T0